MNQILSTGPAKKERKVADIRTVIKFFAISIIIFGVCLVTSGSYAVYKNKIANANKEPQVDNSQNNIGGTDTTQSTIDIQLSVVDANIKITVTSETEISFITYKWDSEDEKREEINSVTGEVTIEVPRGQHTLTVVAVDVNNNTETKQQIIDGVKKPNLKVTQDGENFVVKVSDEIGLDKVEFILNGQGYLVRIEGATEKEFKYPLEDGENTLEVKVYNLDGETEVFNALCRK